MLQVQVSKILDRSAFYLNDVNRAYFTNTVLGPPFAAAYDDLRELLSENDVALMQESSTALSVPVGVTDINGPTGPPFPVDLIVPYELYERLAGSEDQYSLLERRPFLPHGAQPAESLNIYSYTNQMINFIGATSPREVKIDYLADNLIIAEDPNSVVNVYNAFSFLASRTAALAAEYLGENPTRAATLNNDAARSVESMIIIDTKSKQNMPIRRVSFRARRRGMYGAWA